MSLSRAERNRWVIDGVDKRAVKLAKMLAAGKGLRVSEVVTQAIFRMWDSDTDEATFLDEWIERREI